VGGVVGLDCISTNGTTPLHIFFGHQLAQTTINGSSINLNGNVGISLNPSYKLHATAGKTTASTAYAMKVSGGAIQDTGNYGTLIGLGSEDGSWSKCAFGHVRTSSYDVGDIVFYLIQTIYHLQLVI
jgi:hypothetical protein